MENISGYSKSASVGVTGARTPFSVIVASTASLKSAEPGVTGAKFQAGTKSLVTSSNVASVGVAGTSGATSLMVVTSSKVASAGVVGAMDTRVIVELSFDEAGALSFPAKRIPA